MKRNKYIDLQLNGKEKRIDLQLKGQEKRKEQSKTTGDQGIPRTRAPSESSRLSGKTPT